MKWTKPVSRSEVERQQRREGLGVGVGVFVGDGMERKYL
jgi:hypothetical protein